MKYTKISAGFAVTVNLGNYQNIKADAMVEAEVESSDSLNVVEQQLNAAARHAVANQLSEYVLQVASLHLNNCDDEKAVARLLDRSAAYEFIKNLDPKVAHHTKLWLVDEWSNWQASALAELEAQADVVTAQLDARLNEPDGTPEFDGYELLERRVPGVKDVVSGLKLITQK